MVLQVQLKVIDCSRSYYMAYLQHLQCLRTGVCHLAFDTELQQLTVMTCEILPATGSQEPILLSAIVSIFEILKNPCFVIF